MRLPLADALRAGVDYLKRHPAELITAAKHAAGLRVSIPIDAFRWFVDHAPKGKKSPKDVVIDAAPPALSLAATVDLMGTQVRAGASIRVEELRLGPDELRVSIRLSNVKMVALGDANSPIGALLKSGALDLSKPGNLANFMPQRPPALVEAKDDRIVVDLMKVPKIAANERLRGILSVVTPVLVIRDIRTEDDHLLICWRPRVAGIPAALRDGLRLLREVA